jgi:hypothetical protein
MGDSIEVIWKAAADLLNLASSRSHRGRRALSHLLIPSGHARNGAQVVAVGSAVLVAVGGLTLVAHLDPATFGAGAQVISAAVLAISNRSRRSKRESGPKTRSGPMVPLYAARVSDLPAGRFRPCRVRPVRAAMG